MKVTTLKQRTQAGFSLLELLLVVAVGAVLILAGLGAYKLVSENNAGNQGLRQLQTLKAAVQEAYQGTTYPGAAGASMVPALSNMKKLPAEMIVTGNNLSNAYGTTTQVKTVSATQFSLTFTKVPANACTKMGTSFSTASSSDFVNVKIAATTLTTPTVATASTACKTAGGVDMVFTFK